MAVAVLVIVAMLMAVAVLVIVAMLMATTMLMAVAMLMLLLVVHLFFYAAILPWAQSTAAIDVLFHRVQVGFRRRVFLLYVLDGLFEVFESVFGFLNQLLEEVKQKPLVIVELRGRPADADPYVFWAVHATSHVDIVNPLLGIRELLDDDRARHFHDVIDAALIDTKFI